MPAQVFHFSESKEDKAEDSETDASDSITASEDLHTAPAGSNGHDLVDKKLS